MILFMKGEWNAKITLESAGIHWNLLETTGNHWKLKEMSERVEFHAKRVTRTRVYIPKKMWRFAGWWSSRAISPPVWSLNLPRGTTAPPATLSHFLFQRKPNIRET